MLKEIDLTKEAIDLLFWMIIDPSAQWKKEKHYKTDGIGREEIGSLHRWVNNKLYGEEALDRDSVAAKATIQQLYEHYFPKDTSRADDATMKLALEMRRDGLLNNFQKFFLRDKKPGKYKIKDKHVRRLLALWEHYEKLETTDRAAIKDAPDACMGLHVHFADLKAALGGKPLPSAADVEDEAEDGPAEKPPEAPKV